MKAPSLFLVMALTLSAGGLYGTETTAPSKPKPAAKPRGTTPGFTQSYNYISPVDDSKQPYRVYFPANYDNGRAAKYPAVIYLHGFGGRYTGGLTAGMQSAADGWDVSGNAGALLAFADGRGSINYDHVGEQDVLTVRQSLIDNFNADPRRIYLQGFSMGGHGTYRLPLRYPHYFAAANPGAGWTDTNQFYVQYYDLVTDPGLGSFSEYQTWLTTSTSELDTMPDFLEPTHLPLIQHFAALPQVENGLTVPFRAFYRPSDGTNPPENAERMIYFWNEYGHPNLQDAGQASGGHSFEPLENAYAFFQSHVVDPYPLRVVYRTWLLKHRTAYWVTIEDFRARQQQARIEAQAVPSTNTVNVTTTNVESFTLEPGPGLADDPSDVTIHVDGQLAWQGNWDAPVTLYTTRDGDGMPDGWSDTAPAGAPRNGGLKKTPTLEGPINDVMTGPFVVIYGTVGDGGGDADIEAQVEANRTNALLFCGEWNAMMILRWNGNSEITFDWWDPPLNSGVPQYAFGTGTGMDANDAIYPVSDTDAALMDLSGKNLVIFGDPDTSAYIDNLRNSTPITIHNRAEGEGVSIGDRTYMGSDVRYTFIYPRTDDAGTSVVVSKGFPSSLPLLQWNSFSLAKDYEMIAWMFPDYIVYDADLLPDFSAGKASWRNGAGRWAYLPETYLEAGFFNADWQLDELAPAVRVRIDGTDDPLNPGEFLGETMVTLEAADEAGGGGLNKLEYRIDGGAWMTYSGPFEFAQVGSHTIEARATDTASSWVYGPHAVTGNRRPIDGALANAATLAEPITVNPIEIDAEELAATKISAKLAKAGAKVEPGDRVKIKAIIGDNLLPLGVDGAVASFTFGGGVSTATVGPFTLDKRGRFSGDDGAGGTVRGRVKLTPKKRQLVLDLRNVDLAGPMDIGDDDLDGAFPMTFHGSFDLRIADPTDYPAQLKRRKAGKPGKLTYKAP